LEFGLSLKSSKFSEYRMKSRFLLTSILFLFAVSANSQITFQKIFGAGTYCPYGSATRDGNYLCTVDTAGAVNYLFNGYGTPVWKNDVVLNGDVVPSSVVMDQQGNYIFCGTLIDTIGDANALIARLDSNGDTINYKLFPPLNNGNYGIVALTTLDSNYIFETFENGPGTSDTSFLYKLDIGFNVLWSAPTGNSGITSSGVLQDKDSNFVFTHYDQQNLDSITIDKINNNGVQSLRKKFGDATGCDCLFSYCIEPGQQGGYIIGAEFQQQTLLIRVDDNFDTVWTKQLNWGNNTPVSIAHDKDDGYYALINYGGTAAMYHFGNLGDSIGLYQFNPMIITVGSRMERCPDGGYLIAGTTYDYFNVSHGFLLKTDSLIRFVSQGHISSTGPNTICNGDSLTLTGPNGNYHFFWSTGDTTQSIVVHNTGTYYLTIVAMSGTTATLDPLNIVVSNPSTPQIVNNIAYLYASSATPFLYYQWYRNGVVISGAGGDTLVTQQTGNFNVVGIDSIGCVRISPLFYYSLSAIDESVENNFSVYPVPANDLVNVKGNFQNDQFVISDISGRVIRVIENFTGGHLVIDIRMLPPGDYYLHEKNSGSYSKIVKAR
jgi:hypothetical protein